MSGLFANESAPYAPFKTVGTSYEGVVVRTSKVQQTSYVPKSQRLAGKTGELLWWEKPSPGNPGRPKWVYIVTVQTDQRDETIVADDGQRSIWISGKQMEEAVKKAVKDSGAGKDGIVPGGWFGMKFTHETPTEGEDVSPTKHYAATYRPPAPGETQIVADDPWAQPQNPFPAPPGDPWGTQQAPQPSQVQQPAPVAQQPTQQLDTSALPEEARALVEAMLAKQQQGGGQ